MDLTNMRTMRMISSDEPGLQHHVLSQHCVKPVFILIPKKAWKGYSHLQHQNYLNEFPKSLKGIGDNRGETTSMKYLTETSRESSQKKLHFCRGGGWFFSCPKALI